MDINRDQYTSIEICMDINRDPYTSIEDICTWIWPTDINRANINRDFY